jgi:hypothetical protein
MEPRREELRREEPKAPEASAGGKPKRFRIVKLEERIAPSKGGNVPGGGNTHKCGSLDSCTLGCTSLSIE